MRRRMMVLKTLAVGAIVIALGGAALGADSIASASGSENAAGMTAADHASAHVDIGSVAAGVIASLVGGTNPSTDLSRRGSNEHATNANVTADNDTEATETETDNDNEVEGAHDVAPTGTAGTKPGFGCGDANHTHSGPPGRPNATRPPGCDKH